MWLEAGLQIQELAFIGSSAICGSLALYFYSKSVDAEQKMRACQNTVNHLQEGYYHSSLEGKQLCANPALVRLNGYATEAELLESVKDIAIEWYVDPSRRDEFQKELLCNGKVTNFVSEIYRHKSRERIWISENARLVHDTETMEPLYYEGTVRDITEQVKYEEAQARLNKLAANLPGGLFQLARSKEGKFSAPYLSQSFTKLAGGDIDDGYSNPNKYLKNIHPDDIEEYLAAFKTSATDLSPMDITYRYTKKDHDLMWLHLTATPERSDNGETLWHGHLVDITKQKEFEQKIERLAYYDTLTGLPKRSVAQDKLMATVSSCNRREEFASLLFIDLDNFKTLNDTRGHEAGDELLKQVAQRLQGLIRTSDMVARYGGDEFVVIIDNLGKDEFDAKDKAASFANKVLNSFRDSFDLGIIDHSCSPSIGVTMIDPSLPSAEELLSQADNAMYQAKKNGRNNYVIFGANCSGKNTLSTNYGDDLAGAVTRNEFQLLFQPQLNNIGIITGAEAFIRWNHPKNGVLSPGEFMPTAEKSGIIVEINNWVIDQAITQLEKWQLSETTSKLRLAINIGIQQFSTKDFASDLEAKLFKAGIDRSLLTFELTESVLNRSVDRVRSKMLEIKKCGIRFALDDFGIGSTSLASLSNLPFDQVKIDGFLVSAIESESQSRSLIEGILGIAKALDLEVVGEHLGNSYQEKFLHERGCVLAQGFYYYPPMDIASFELLDELKPNQNRLRAVG